MIGDHQGVGAQARVGGISLVLDPAEQTLLAQQPLHEVEVALLVLDAQGALGVDAGVCQVPAPRGGELALPLVVGEDVFDDLDHGAALEDVGVGAVGEEAEPRLDDEAVARQPAVAAEQLGLGDVAVKGAQGVAALRCQQLQQGGLADEGLELDVGVGGERVHGDAAADGRSVGVAAPRPRPSR